MNEVLRQEKKYLMNLLDSQRLSSLLRQVMRQDEHNKTGGYKIRSLYFDTLEDEDFNEKISGLELRKKLRLRCYDPENEFAMLEMKQKEGNYQRKRSLRIWREDAMRLSQGDYLPLLHYQDPFAEECYGLMNRKCYRPKVIVEYRREAFIARENKIRITLDSRVMATEANMNLFSPQLALYPVVDPFHLILEVKYNGFLLSYIKSLLDSVDRSEISVSKYCLARCVSKGDSSY